MLRTEKDNTALTCLSRFCGAGTEKKQVPDSPAEVNLAWMTELEFLEGSKLKNL